MKDTKMIHIKNGDDLNVAAEILKKGGTVAFPTETVYGLGANALMEAAIDQIYVAKGRPSDNPLIVHLSSLEMMTPLVENVSEKAKKVMDVFWPGPITLILQSKGVVAPNVTAGLSTLGIRIPSHPIAKKLIELSGVPVAAPSANLSGKPSPTEGKHVVEDLTGRVDAIVIEEQSEHGLESTILDMTQEPPMLLRPGSVTREAIEAVIGSIEVDPALNKKMAADVQPKAPGMKYTHYSPDADLKIIQGPLEKVVTHIQTLVNNTKGKVGVMCCDETLKEYSAEVVLSLGKRSDLTEIASNLFKTLRKFDELGVDIVYCEGYDTLGMGQAIMNRLNKAAGYEIINL
ncbi:MAG: threonylcarbamoyl-AMP synthase [Clostridia bacterium]|nr:threonylcarbamoyl-AMP synthase [Clostridia bacterium]